MEKKKNGEGKGGKYLEKEINGDANQPTDRVNIEQSSFSKVGLKAEICNIIARSRFPKSTDPCVCGHELTLALLLRAPISSNNSS